MDIWVKNLTKKYGLHQVFDNQSFHFKEGRINCLMGSSGSGKTTLLRILMGVEQADAGIISGIAGKRISAVFQEDRLIGNLSVYSNFFMVCGGHVERTAAVHHLQQTGLNDISKWPVRELSGGMKRRVAIIRAMLVPAELFFLDEPLKGLDLISRQQTIRYLKQQLSGKTAVLVTHDAEAAEQLGGEIIVVPDLTK